MDDNTIKTLDQYVKTIIEEQCRLRNGRIAVGMPVMSFRGHSNKEYQLMPSIGRFIDQTNAEWLNEEANIINMAKAEHKEVFQKSNTPLEDLTLLQHYGMPTRLLDITQNALIALYFACVDNKESDGEVLIFESEYVPSYHFVSEAIADSYRIAPYDKERLSNVIDRMIQQSYYVPDASPINPLDEDDIVGFFLQRDLFNKPRIVNPPKLTMRQVLQSSRYILFANRVDRDGIIHKIIDPIDKEDDFIKGRLVIEANSKMGIIRDLEAFGITKEYLFRDNVDTSFSFIKKKLNERYLK